MTADSLMSTWRRAAIDRWHDAQDHVGQADTNPDPYIQAAADAAVRVLLEHLLDYSGPARYNQVELDAQYVEGIYESLVGKPYDEDTR